MSDDVRDALHEFFTDISAYACPVSTRVVRVQTGIGLRDNELDTIELPPYISKRSLHKRFCDERGWEVNTDGNGLCQLIASDSNVEEVVSFSTFLNYWNKHFPLMRICSPSKDVCYKCHIFHHYFVKLHKNDEQKLRNDDDDKDYSNSDYSSEDESSDDEEERAEKIRAACLHVNQAADQRKLANEKIAAAEADEIANKQHSKRTRCIVMDYSQNAGLPQFGDSQAGPTYYYSPITINIFGIIDTSMKGGRPNIFVYHEGQGGKGGNNVASLLMLYLRYKGLLKCE